MLQSDNKKISFQKNLPAPKINKIGPKINTKTIATIPLSNGAKTTISRLIDSSDIFKIKNHRPYTDIQINGSNLILMRDSADGCSWGWFSKFGS